MISGLSNWTWITVPPIHKWNTEELKAFVYWMLGKIMERRQKSVNTDLHHFVNFAKYQSVT